jgi:hypothetical protein
MMLIAATRLRFLFFFFIRRCLFTLPQDIAFPIFSPQLIRPSSSGRRRYVARHAFHRY